MRALWEGRFAEGAAIEEEAFAVRARLAQEGAPHRSVRALATAILREEAEATERAAAEVLATFAQDTPEDADLRALALAQRGELERARAMAAARIAHHEDGRLPDDPHLLSLLAGVAWRARDATLARMIYPILAGRAGEPYVITGIAFVLAGVMDHALMRVAAVLGDAVAAERHARAALALCDRLGALPIAASVRGDWAAFLEDRDRERALGLAREALDAATRLGMPALERRCRDTLAHLERPARAAEEELALALEGEYFTVTGWGETCRVRDSRGMRMLAELVAQPGRELHVLDLSGAGAAVDGGDAGELLDRRARDAYRERLDSVRAELAQAVSWNDAGRRARLERELDDLTRELAAAFGLGGRARRSGAASERARSNVRRRLVDALQRIGDACPRLGARLSAAVRTGTYCAYDPRRAAIDPG
jgi:hypothetical protein